LLLVGIRCHPADVAGIFPDRILLVDRDSKIVAEMMASSTEATARSKSRHEFGLNKKEKQHEDFHDWSCRFDDGFGRIAELR
jgi:hypothetical protein